MFSRLSANAIDSPDDLSLTASVAPVTFRQGDGGPFSETDDTYIASGAPDTNFGANPQLLVDGSGCRISPATVCKTLIKFPHSIGPNPGQVPPGSTIVNANLELMITNKGTTQGVSQVTEPWSEAGATWNGFNPAGSPATKSGMTAPSPTSVGLYAINVIPFVQAWVDGEPNEGILLATASSDGIAYESSESANPPTLTVQFIPPSSSPPGFTIVDLGTLPGDSSAVAHAINDAGQVVGESTGSDEAVHAVIWTPSSSPVPGPLTLSFQKGDGSPYSETDDTYISSGRPDTNYGTSAALFVDASGCKVSPATACKALLKFPNFLGSNAGQVKPGSVILSATLQIEITNAGGTQFLYQLTEDWSEWGATWNGFASPGSPGTKGTGLSFSAPLGVVTLNITAIVQNWVNGDANDGLLIWSNSADGVDYPSSESTNPPKLTVTFRSP